MTEKMGGIGAVLAEELDLARNLSTGTRATILVEGESDRRAVETLARRLGRDLPEEGVAIVAIAGATNVERFVSLLGPDGRGLDLVGLCDEGELPSFRAAFDRVELADAVFACVIDLEDELIRALGTARMLEVIDSQEESRAFLSFQHQPDQRHKTVEQQMWRWMGNRKIRYASVLVDALDLDRVPDPLRKVLDVALGRDSG